MYRSQASAKNMHTIGQGPNQMLLEKCHKCSNMYGAINK